MSNDALTLVSPRTSVTPQRTKARADQVKNNAGGFVFEVSPETQLRRFLILGTTGGTYYQNEAELTRQNGDVVIDWATNRTRELVDILLEISEAGRAPKQNPTIFALAAAAGLGATPEDRQYALDALPRICRTGTHLFLFAKYIGQFRGWGRGLRNAVGAWYDEKSADSLAYQIAKYRQREGWTHRDLLRKAHPAGSDAEHKALYSWVTKNEKSEVLPRTIEGFERAQAATDTKTWVKTIEDYNISWEMLPDAALTERDVWAALLEKGIPMTALVRQLPRLTNLGLLTGDSLKTVLAQLGNQEYITKSRMHPMNVLIAQQTYASGRSLRGSGSWSPNTKVIDALDAAFYKAFGNVNPAGKRTLNALDVSGSMTSAVNGFPFLSCRDASAAMSLITLATEPEAETIGFTGGLGYWGGGREAITKLNISARQRLDDVIRTISGLPFGGTDCALPMIWAQENGLEFDHFQIFTDNETWAGNKHPYEALRDYRKASGIPATLAVVAFTATRFSIADPRDSGMMDFAGLDSAMPQLLADFAAGRI